MSDLKSRESAPRIPDLSQPTLEGLSFLLRNRRLWPADFEWFYPSHNQCALALGSRFWGSDNFEDAPFWPEDPDQGDRLIRIFFALPRGTGMRYEDVTPGMVADAIDEYLAKEKS